MLSIDYVLLSNIICIFVINTIILCMSDCVPEVSYFLVLAFASAAGEYILAGLPRFSILQLIMQPTHLLNKPSLQPRLSFHLDLVIGDKKLNVLNKQSLVVLVVNAVHGDLQPGGLRPGGRRDLEPGRQQRPVLVEPSCLEVPGWILAAL